jgi:hypothetical protein
MENSLALGFAQVQGDAFFVSVERSEARAVTFVFWVAATVGIAPARKLDFNHLATEVAEEHAGVRAGHMAAHFNGHGSFECSRNHHERN